MRFGIGQPVPRKEDPRFLTGRGRFVADIDFARQAYASLSTRRTPAPGSAASTKPPPSKPRAFTPS